MNRVITAALVVGLMSIPVRADTFSIEITDADQLAGIKSAMDAYNANNPQNLQAKPQDFFTLMISSQFAQWAQQKLDGDLQKAIEAAKGGDTTLLSSVVQRLNKK